METKIEIMELNPEAIIIFIHAPAGYKLTKFSFEFGKSKYIGKLNSFNRIKALQKLKNDEFPDLVAAFKLYLKTKNWDFDLYPNPLAFLSVCPNK